MELDAILERSCERDWQTTPAESVDTLRVAVIGLGWFTRGRALPALEGSGYCEPTVLVSGSAEKARSVVAETDSATHGISYDDFHDGVASDAYDAVYIVTPNALHLDYVRTAAELGKAVLCEKPAERSSERAAKLVETCETHDVPLMIAYRMHTEPAVRRARDVIDAGLIGDPQAVRGSMSQRLLDRINDDPDQWRLDENVAGGGALFDLGVYPLNTARFLLGSDPVAACGRTKRSHDAFDEVDETVSFTVEFPDDVYASCFASHNARQESEIVVTGTEGQVAVRPAFFQDQARSIHVSRGAGRASVELEVVDQMLEEFDYFAHQVRTGDEILADGTHGLVDMQAMEAVYESERTDGWVALD
ncbi:D-xylose 1-dehydrogenase Gfo6 [Halomarina halobia]|uniref:D-xylose 1-dehydrogenase Gfo6 n=1 Tax=Halomarina halobia TaxID=3033386 RepID=A0ABD6AEL5_9EURY|nr:D-xylose 1-dehydrogenase Gfo6 [Halomarina sp. PSR21]